jgi:hypothetical protein
MFQFKNELVFNKNKDELLVEDEDINDIYSDLSGNEFDAEQDQTEGDNFVMESSCLQL